MFFRVSGYRSIALATFAAMKRTNAAKRDEWRIHVEAQGHFFKLQVQQSSARAKVGGVRGAVWQFSHASRKRMLERLARIDVDKAGFVTFVTLTYPDREGPPTPQDADRDRQNFQKRVNRLFPDASAIWRREWECRKTGRFDGVSFPHYHYLFFLLPFLEADRLNRMWAEVLGWSDYVRTEIKGVKSWRQAFYYVAKYMAKPVGPAADEPPEGPGPAARKAGPGSGGEAASSLVYGAYLTAPSDEEEREERERNRKSAGKSWGIFNRKRLPLAERQKLTLPHGEWLLDAKKLGQRQWSGIPDHPAYGYSLFVDNPADWAECMAALAKIDATGELPDDLSILDPVNRSTRKAS